MKRIMARQPVERVSIYMMSLLETGEASLKLALAYRSRHPINPTERIGR